MHDIDKLKATMRTYRRKFTHLNSIVTLDGQSCQRSCQPGGSLLKSLNFKSFKCNTHVSIVESRKVVCLSAYFRDSVLLVVFDIH